MNGKHNLFWLLCWFWKIPCHCSVVIPTSSFRQMISTHLRTEGRKFPCSFFQFPAINQWKIMVANQIIHGKRPYHYSMVIPASTFRKIVISHFSPSRRVGFVSKLIFFHRTPYWLLVDAGFLTKSVVDTTRQNFLSDLVDETLPVKALASMIYRGLKKLLQISRRSLHVVKEFLQYYLKEN